MVYELHYLFSEGCLEKITLKSTEGEKLHIVMCVDTPSFHYNPKHEVNRVKKHCHPEGTIQLIQHQSDGVKCHTEFLEGYEVQDYLDQHSQHITPGCSFHDLY